MTVNTSRPQFVPGLYGRLIYMIGPTLKHARLEIHRPSMSINVTELKEMVHFLNQLIEQME